MISNTANFTPEELNELEGISGISQGNRFERRPFYRKTGFEHGPSWHDRKEYVHRLIYDSNIDLEGKRRLKENFNIVPHFQSRGFKYGLVVSSSVFFFLPVVKRQLFLRRLAISSIPLIVFLRWGYIWGHQTWWRKTYPVVTTYEVGAGLRNQFTGK
mmetsp:Transcript_6869/g.6018  ORF Transcript_6869/g.6018 Transcript_6869/m.6018 type:complete len:157 (-) Transcript_6869:35-505(-)